MKTISNNVSQGNVEVQENNVSRKIVETRYTDVNHRNFEIRIGKCEPIRTLKSEKIM